MRQLFAFVKKEFMESARSGKILIVMILFILFGIMNPAIAKLTPWLIETMSDSFAETGLTIALSEPDALASWVQFYKNAPIFLIIFLLLFSGILTAEYQKGTLINIVTKGMERWKIIAAKVTAIMVFWTVGYWLCYGITWGYTAYFWDNNIISHIVFPAVCIYLFGIWLVSLLLLMSVIFRSNSSVIIAVFGVFLIVYLLGLLSDIKKYLPVMLLYSSNLLTNIEKCSEYLFSAIIVVLLFLLNIMAAIIGFNKKNI